MEISLDNILSIAGLLLGGSGMGAFFTWRWQRAKAKAEAKEAESTAAKSEQDVYQQIIADLKADREDMKAYNLEVKRERDEIRDERDKLRERLDEMEATIRQLQRDVARNGRMVEAMRPFICTDAKCKSRRCVIIDEMKPEEQ